ncbi:MAG TPA: hypothetical protein VF054_19595 [Micromonosporaceae bacterium]
MKLTVGPLPPAVYWRRRAVVLGGILLVVVLITYSCSGGSGTGGGGATGSGQPTSGSGGGLLRPTIGDSSSASPTPTGSPDVSNSEIPTTTPAVAAFDDSAPTCSDSDIQVTVVADPASFTPPSLTRLTIKIKNISTHSCNRDVGADPQELRVMSGSKIVWSSDYCQTTHGQPDVRTFGPNVEATFYQEWDGRSVAPKCVRGGPLPTGSYQVVARLDTKYSPAVTLTVK